jgi:hypothetical protein
VPDETTRNAASCPLGLCDGSGKIQYTAHREFEPGQVPFGEGAYIGSETTYGSNLCRCRADLERRPGRARWWSSETTFSETVELATLPGEVELSASTEIPISEDNYPLIRDGENFYWPTLIQIGDLGTVTASDARLFAEALVRAAESAEASDNVPAAAV